ncbi:glycosyltransferase family 4 protein [Calothrix membranacea FACHB-236]|nr:glycosyltransferase family 4 protein [Calothrix membranacea FACHB-236]
MRIFIDCTHTANYTYKNTGIHRVVRQLTSELDKLSSSSSYTNIELVAVMFDGNFMRKVTNLNPENNSEATIKNPYIYASSKIIMKFQVFWTKLKNKFLNLFPFILIQWIYLNLSKSKNGSLRFEGLKILPGDIYIIADANWDLPKTYYNFLNFLKQHGVVIAVICYDLIPIKLPEFCDKNFAAAFTKFYRDYSDLFDKVLCISKNSAKDYMSAQNAGIIASDNSKLTVKSFRLGCDYSNPESLVNIDNNFDQTFRELLNSRYILVVGSLAPHKNIKTIMTAFDLLVDSNTKEINLLFAGNRGWHSETDMLIESNKMYGKLIHILGAVTDEQLSLLYRNCYCLVQASFYEGFGLPVVEALQYSKPVIASNGGSLPEVGGDFCLYFDPYQPLELYEALKRLINSDTDYNQLVSRIKNDYRPFSWQECAEDFLFKLCN